MTSLPNGAPEDLNKVAWVLTHERIKRSVAEAQRNPRIWDGAWVPRVRDHSKR